MAPNNEIPKDCLSGHSSQNIDRKTKIGDGKMKGWSTLFVFLFAVSSVVSAEVVWVEYLAQRTETFDVFQTGHWYSPSYAPPGQPYYEYKTYSPVFRWLDVFESFAYDDELYELTGYSTGHTVTIQPFMYKRCNYYEWQSDPSGGHHYFHSWTWEERSCILDEYTYAPVLETITIPEPATLSLLVLGGLALLRKRK